MPAAGLRSPLDVYKRQGKRKLFICGGYLLWGLSTAAFGLVTVENAAKLFPAASAVAAAAVMIVVLDLSLIHL